MRTTTSRTDVGVGTTTQTVETKDIEKIKIANPNPSTLRTDAGVGTTTQRAETSGYILDDQKTSGGK